MRSALVFSSSCSLSEIILPDAASTETALPVDSTAFRALMGQFATGVCVVSARGPDGDPLGITINSFVSVSLDPMLVCWSLHNSASQFDVWSTAPAYSISILAEDQRAIAEVFASRGEGKDSRDLFTSGQTGVPHIAGTLGYLECRPWDLVQAGDHTMILGEVMGLYRPENAAKEDLRPLLFFGSRFRQIAPE